MSEFIVLLLMQATIFSSVTALIILAVKGIFNCWIPPKIGVLMWVVLLLRLVSPIFPESGTSVYNIVPMGRDIMFTLKYDVEDELEARALISQYENNPYIIHTTDGSVEAEIRDRLSSENPRNAVSIGKFFSTEISETQNSDRAESLTQSINGAIVAVYLAGVAVSLALNFGVYFKARRRAMLIAAPCTDEALLEIYRKTALGLGINEKKIPPLMVGHASMLIGCFSPKVICVEGLTKREAEMTFAHELNHYKYSDNPILLFSTAVACLFWFNPFLWTVRNTLREDIEVLCDERTLSHCNVSGSEYAVMLCKNSGIGQLFENPAACYLSGTGRKLKFRLKTISHAKKRKITVRLASAALCLSMVVICLTNPVISMNSDYAEFIENYSQFTGENKRAMHFSSQVTVTEYLGQISAIIGEVNDESFSDEVGNGSLEKFRRICYENEYVSNRLYLELRNLKTDEILTNKSMAVINSCLVSILANGCETEGLLVPQVVREDDMKDVISRLSVEEAQMVLACYNKGMDNVEVEFSYVYTEAMMDLIKNRIQDDWDRSRLDGFYTRARVGDVREMYAGTDLEKVIYNVRDDEIIYTCTKNITKSEEREIRAIIKTAESGDDGSIYYLRTAQRLCTDSLLEELFRKGGFSLDKMYEGYAEIGVTGFEFVDRSDYMLMTDIDLDYFGDRIKSYNPNIGGAIYDFYKNASNISDEYVPRGGECYYALCEQYASVFENLMVVLNMASFPVVREDECSIRGYANDVVSGAVEQSYRLGFIDEDELGYVDLSGQISCGESLYYAYRLVCSMENVN
jgi:beta-lactamase regulating signal transducer with metallopeptidase domain